MSDKSQSKVEQETAARLYELVMRPEAPVSFACASVYRDASEREALPRARRCLVGCGRWTMTPICAACNVDGE